VLSDDNRLSTDDDHTKMATQLKFASIGAFCMAQEDYVCSFLGLVIIDIDHVEDR